MPPDAEDFARSASFDAWPFFAISALSRAITIGRVEVPRYPVVGNRADLVCNYDLEKGRDGQEEKLYSVKWYKDGSEFYR